MLKECLAFIKKDFLNARSYKASFFMSWFWALSSLFTCFFIAKLVGDWPVSYLSDYGGKYFPFLLVGITLANYIGASLGGFNESINSEQWSGTLEVLFVSPVKISTLILSMNLWKLINASINVIIYLLLATLLLGVRFNNANIFAGIVILSLTIISFSSIGIISSALILVFKRGGILNPIFGGMAGFFGGLYFPITILPKWLQIISHSLPLTYSLRALRHALIMGYSFRLLANDIIILALFSLILLPISIFCFKAAVKIAKRNASLSFY